MRIDNDKVKLTSDQVVSAFKTYAEEYMSNSERFDCTPTEEQAVEDVFVDGDSLYSKNKIYASMNSEEQAEVRARTKKDIERNTRNAYRYSMERKHRVINGHKPYSITSAQKADCWNTINNARQFANSTINDMLNKCFQQGKLPSREAMNNYISSCFDAGVNRYSSLLAPNQKAFCRQQVELKRDRYLQLYDDLASRMRVTGTFPTGTQIDTSVIEPYSKNRISPEYGQSDRLANSAPKEVIRPTGKGLVSEWARTNVSFSGADMVVSASMATTNGSHVFVTLGSLQTLSYSIYRKLSPILNIGNINAKDYVGGPRTIAGSLVFTVFNKHWGSELLDKFITAEGYASNRKLLMDEVAPIDLTISMANEYGVCSRIAIYGVRLFSEGQVMSINDMYTENTYQYVALNIDYMADIDVVDDIWGKDDTSYIKQTMAKTPTPPPPPEAGREKTVPVITDDNNVSGGSTGSNDEEPDSKQKTSDDGHEDDGRAASSDTEQPAGSPGQAPDLKPAGRPGSEEQPTKEGGRAKTGACTTAFDGLPFFFDNYETRQKALQAAACLLATHKNRYKGVHRNASVSQITKQNEEYDRQYRKLVADINEYYQ